MRIKLIFRLRLFPLATGIFISFVFFSNLTAQNDHLRRFCVIAYNVENYFDCIDDTMRRDKEFLPGGMRGWNTQKYRQKQGSIAKVIAAISAWETAALVGLSEVGSRKSMIDLCQYSVLKSFDYKFIHYESPDKRGIDVALLYHPYQFFPVSNEAISIKFPNSTRTTRDILYAKGTNVLDDTLHIFVCHFPSRFAGELESEDGRIFVASVLRNKVDSLFSIQNKANIIIMGDFNDYPLNRSLLKVLRALPLSAEIEDSELYNLAYELHTKAKGSHKYEGEWGMLDQFIVSGNLLNKNNHFYTSQNDMHIFDADFLLEEDEKHLGKLPFRTYIGFKYNKGFSDHLPVYLNFWYP